MWSSAPGLKPLSAKCSHNSSQISFGVVSLLTTKLLSEENLLIITEREGYERVAPFQTFVGKHLEHESRYFKKRTHSLERRKLKIPIENPILLSPPLNSGQRTLTAVPHSGKPHLDDAATPITALRISVAHVLLTAMPLCRRQPGICISGLAALFYSTLFFAQIMKCT